MVVTLRSARGRKLLPEKSSLILGKVTTIPLETGVPWGLWWVHGGNEPVPSK